jgi:hypothetical protein
VRARIRPGIRSADRAPRTWSGDREVDLIVERGRRILALEVKLGQVVDDRGHHNRTGGLPAPRRHRCDSRSAPRTLRRSSPVGLRYGLVPGRMMAVTWASTPAWTWWRSPSFSRTRAIWALIVSGSRACSGNPPRPAVGVCRLPS